MRPIPKSILIHSAVLVTEYSPDLWGKSTESSAAPLDNVRIDPCRTTMTDSRSQTITLSANLFFDCANSSCAVPFYLEGDKDGDGKIVKNQFVEWHGRRYGVKTIEPIYDSKKLHHYEVGLI